MSNENKNPKFNETLARAYTTTKGDYMSVDIGSEEFDNIQKIEVGGRLSFKLMKTKKHDKSPDGYFEYMTPQKVKGLKEFLAIKKAQAQANHAPNTTGTAEDVL